MPRNGDKNAFIYLLIVEIMHQHFLQLCLVIDLFVKMKTRKRKRSEFVEPYYMIERIPNQVKDLDRIIGASDTDCIVNLRMDRNTFGRLCLLLRQPGGLIDQKYVSVEEQVAIFLGILAHDEDNRIVRGDYWRSGQTVTHYVHAVLMAILKLHEILLVKPEPVPDDCNDPRWKSFKGCLGALDSTYINVTVPNVDKPRYMTRKGQISTNTLAVCDRNLKFVYVLAGWEGSATDFRVLQDAINRVNGLRVPRGNYYLSDNGYANSDGFLSPYKGVKYHLKEWGPASEKPQNKEEMFNMRHAEARNIIERAFGIMKMRWEVLRSPTYYPVKVQNRLMMACVLLNNFIRSQMIVDPIEEQFDAIHQEDEDDVEPEDCIDGVESTPEWNEKRDAIAQAMWEQYILQLSM